jgi:hypothetical protein
MIDYPFKRLLASLIIFSLHSLAPSLPIHKQSKHLFHKLIAYLDGLSKIAL